MSNSNMDEMIKRSLKFLKYFPATHSYGTEHQMAVDEILYKIIDLASYSF